MAGESIIPPPIFPEEAQNALRIFKALRVVDLPGKPTFGECSEPWVFDFVAAIFGAYDAEMGKQKIREYGLLISKKNSKALALDTPIPTPAGWTTMGELQQGDWVFGADGKPCRVTATSPVFRDHKCYELGFSNGERVVADAGHLWLTRALADKPGGGKGNGGDLTQRRTRVRTTEEIANTLLRPGDGARNHSMPMPAPIECSPVELPVAPYTLGAWLGDGHSEAAIITTHRDDLEILEHIREDGWPTRLYAKTGSAADSYSLSDGDRSQKARNVSLAAKLRAMGVLNNKHIPDVYFRASYEQRLALIQGLMDTDGTVNKTGRLFCYSGVNERLVRGVGELLSTFGIKSTFIERSVTCNGVDAGTAFFVQFSVFRDEVPVFRLKRKLARMRVSNSRVARIRSVQITEAREVASVPTKCITVDSPDHQFLFGRSMLPTHNSTIAAGIMLTATILCWREDEEHLILAPTKEVADNSFKPAAGMIRADDELSDLFHIQPNIRTITHRVTKASLKVVAADTDTVSGKKSGKILVDELWVFGKRSNAEAMFLEALGGQVSRDEGWVIYLTTQSDEPPAGVFREKLQYWRDVRDGKIEDRKTLGVIYEFPQYLIESKGYLKPENFYITNPNIGRSVSAEWLEDNLRKNQAKTDGSFQQFLAKHLNVEIGMNLRSDRWAGADFWEPAGDPSLTFEQLLARSEVVVFGIDGGGLDDLLGMAAIGREKGTRRWLHWAHAWAHEIVLQRRKEIAPRLIDFQRSGQLTVVRRPGDDVEEVAAIVGRAREAGLLPAENAVGVDSAGIAAIVDALMAPDMHFNDKQVVAVQQGWRLNGAIKTVERMLAGGELIHGGTEMMAWVVSNARVEQKVSSIYISKQMSGTAKIDPLLATFDAASLMSLNPAPARKEYAIHFV